MKSYKLTGIERFGLFDVPEPTLHGTSEVLIKVNRVGICGSDVHYYSEGGIGSQIVEYPWSVGHEGSGTVVEIDPAMPCYQCVQCLAGRPHTCFQLKFLGCPQQVEGCLSEFLVLPERSCLPIPDEMTLESAALVEPLSIAVYGASLYPSLAGATVGILGAGPIGISMLQVVRSSGAKSIYVTDKITERLRRARGFGANWSGYPTKTSSSEIRAAEPAGLDVVFECCGQQGALDQGIDLLKPGGELSIIGIPDDNRVSFDINLLRRKEISIQNVRRQNDCMIRALNMIADGSVNAVSMITHRFPFSETPEAFDLVKSYRDGVIKAMISFD